jgi:hypothetical protein
MGEFPGIIPFIRSGAKTMEEFADMKARETQNEIERLRNETAEDKALYTAAYYRRLLKARHPGWSEAKIIKKIKQQFNIIIS